MSKKDDTRDPLPPPELLLELPAQGLEIWRTHLEHIAEQQRNAQVVPPEMLERLAETIRRDHRLESLPYVVKHVTPEGLVRFEMVSGHHRLRAARAAALMELIVLADTNELDRSSLVAKQLAHNQIAGTPDPQVVADMFAEIDNLEDALEAYVDPDLLAGMIEDEETFEPPEEEDAEWHMVAVAFLPLQMSDFTRLLDRLTGQEKLLGAADHKVFRDLQTMVTRLKDVEDIRNIGGQLVRMVELAHERLDELEQA